MNSTLPAGWRGRLLALSLLAVAAGAVYLAAAVPLLDLYAERANAIETRRTLLMKLDAVAGELPMLRNRLTELRSLAGTRKLLLEGASDSVAAAALQGSIEELASAAGATIGSTESLPTETQGSFRRLGLRLVFAGPYESLMRLVSEIETTTPPLAIDNLQIHALQRRVGAPTAALDASLEVYGFRNSDSSGAGKP